MVDVFGTNFEPHTLTFADQFLLIFWDGGSTTQMEHQIWDGGSTKL